jgi:uncharacterized protein (TIGR02231 family)
MTNLDAPIVAVTVFVNRARVTRRGTVRLAPGEHTLALPNAPRALDPDSIRASGRGAGVRILGVDMVTRYVAETPDSDAAALQRALDDLREQDQVLIDEDAQQSDRLELLKSLRENSGARFAKALATGKASIDTLKPVAQYLADEFNAVTARRRDLANQRRELDNQITAAEKRLAQAGSTTSREWREIQVAVEASVDTDLELEVTYAVSGASWEPIYDVRLVEDKVSLTYLAQVRQQSGEDWPAVQLSLSTARPATSMVLPKLSPWYVDRYVAPPPRMMPPPAPAAMRTMAAQAAPKMLMEQVANYDAGAPAPEAEAAEAEIDSEGAAVTYRVLRPVAVPSDGSPHKTTVTMLNLEARLDYVIAPKIATEAYLRAKIRNTSPVMLLPGRAQIFHGDEFVGAMQIRRVVAPDEEFETQLGIEDRIKVERELMERSTNKAFIGNVRRLTIGYRIKLSNNLPAPARVTVSDQLPVSRHEDIKIKLQDAQPRPSEQSDLNILKWELDMPAQSKREFTYVFVLEHPRDATVTGLGHLDTD